MTLGNDFSLSEAEGKPIPVTGQALPSVIVIENRHRGLASRLMAPALILFAALAISSYQRKTPVWPLTPRVEPIAAAPTQSSPAVLNADGIRADSGENRTNPAEAHPVKPTPVPGFASDPPVVTSGLPDPGHERTKSDPDAVKVPDTMETLAATGTEITSAPLPSATIPFSRTRERRPNPNDSLPQPQPLSSEIDQPGPPPLDTPEPSSGDGLRDIEREAEQKDAKLQGTPEPSRDDILRDIEREAEQKDAQRLDLQGLKANARGLLLNEALTNLDAKRVPFREELKGLLVRMGDGAGEEIAKLSDQYGKELMPQVKAAYVKRLRTAPGRESRQSLVARMRSLGVPEPLILDQLCNDYHNLMNTRNGPRTEDEVRVRAARALLALPLPAAASNSLSPTSPPRPTYRSDAKAASRPVTNYGTRP